MSARFHREPAKTAAPTDLVTFLEAVDGCDLLRPEHPVFVARAPGRLDVMGGIADYSGSLVLELPLREACCCAVQLRVDGRVVAVSPGGADRSSRVEVSLDDLVADGADVDYGAVHARFARSPRDRWAAYVAGALPVLARERGVPMRRGATFLLASEVPEGSGVSSSAAVEVASMMALAAALQLDVAPVELARLCQVVENRVAGAPCGIMDQMTAACGERDRLLALRCQPCSLEGQLTLPPGIALFGIDSGVARSIAGDAYARVRAAAFMGYCLLAERRGYPVARDYCRVHVDDRSWNGYLARCRPETLAGELADVLPESMEGAAFLARFGGSPDAATELRPELRYPVRPATEHPIHENARVERFRDLLRQPATPDALGELGDLMFASHASYTACGLGRPETDWLVDAVREARRAGRGVHGARVTGGGDGGTVAVLGDEAGALAVGKDIAQRYARETGRPARIFAGSSEGAARCGVYRLVPGE